MDFLLIAFFFHKDNHQPKKKKCHLHHMIYAAFLATNMTYVVTHTHLINLHVLQSHESASFQPTINNSIYITHHALYV